MNRFGKQSRLLLDVACENGRSFLQDSSFTAPFKVMKPFYGDDLMQIMVLSVSAGLMAGDDQAIDIRLGAGARARIGSQAAEKVHAMPPELRASRRIAVHLAQNSSLVYTPLPVIPFADSAFAGTIAFDLEDATASLVYCDIIAAGRVAGGECFAFREYRNRATVRQAGRLVYADNVVFLPLEHRLEGLTLFEGFTHTGTMLLVNHGLGDEQIQRIAARCEDFEGIAAATITGCGALCVKTLANGSEPIQLLHDELVRRV